MLILTRVPNSAIHIGPDIVITVLGVKGRSVRIGVSAPKELKVLRDELVESDDPGLWENHR